MRPTKRIALHDGMRLYSPKLFSVQHSRRTRRIDVQAEICHLSALKDALLISIIRTYLYLVAFSVIKLGLMR